MRRTLSRTALAGLLGLALQAAHATDTATPPTARPKPAIVSRDDLPLWEIGIAAAGAGSPDYPGSGRTRARVLPLPYGIYRGKTLFEGDEISRNRFKFSRTVELDLSFSGALPADSNGSKERDGMPDLDLLLEIGPQLSVLLARPTRSTAFTLALPVRAVFSTDFDHLNIRGLLFAPELSYTNGKFASRGWSGRVTLGTSFATEQLADYFYQVAPRFVREDRPAYDASGGYLESSLTTVISRSFVNDISLFTFLRLASLSGSSNSHSPLLRDESNLSFGIGFAYTFLHSEKMVADD
mgnify:CR=1 FL=1